MTFYELEKKCKQRRLKKYGLIAFLIFFVFASIGYLLFNSSFDKSSNNSNFNKEYDNNTAIGNDTEDIESLNMKKIEEKRHIKTEHNKNEYIKENTNMENKAKNITKEKNISAKKAVNSHLILTLMIPGMGNLEKKDNNKSKVKVNTNNHKINNTKSNEPIIQVESLPPYKKCIELARKYLREEKYDLALKWAKNANIQNKDLPDSWIITSEALFFSGDKEKAINILKIYLKYHQNKKVKRLLKEFEDEKNNN